MAYIKFQNRKYDIPAGSTAKRTFESLQQVLPELSNAKLVADGTDGNYKAEVSYGRKG